jgi:cobalt-zinc-cadmium efflux system membrane fusion protein
MTQLVLIMTLAVLAFASVARAGDDDEHADHADEHADHDDAEPPTARVAVLEQFGVTLATAGPGIVDPGLELPGEIRPDATRTAHVAARFAGVARSVHARVGDRARRGDVLAVVESQTLAPYELRAPFDGTVVESLLVLGETADPATPAFVVSDLDVVWAEISVYQKHLAQVRPGQRVRITAGYGVADAEGAVSYVSPILDETTRTATARAILSNPDGRWRPGMFVTAHVLDPVAAAVAVPTTALQREGDDQVVFVVDGDVFRPRRVTLGRIGLTTAEITAGLQPGERFAATGSYLVKAELGKGAGHGHAH